MVEMEGREGIQEDHVRTFRPSGDGRWRASFLRPLADDLALWRLWRAVEGLVHAAWDVRARKTEAFAAARMQTDGSDRE